jgi:DNA-binding NarL/FixJ family response regulator
VHGERDHRVEQLEEQRMSPTARRRAADLPDASPVTVLTVDDQPVFRRAIASLLAATPAFEQVGEAASGREALALAARLRPDLVLLDVRMPQMDGIETAQYLADAAPDTAVVLLSIDDLPALAARPATSGAAAYVRKRDLSVPKLLELWAAITHGS